MSASQNALSSLDLSIWDRIEGLWDNAAYGTVSPAQKQALVMQTAQGIVKASGGTISLDDAVKQAQGVVTPALVAEKADPSQASVFNNPGLDNLLSKIGWIIEIIVAIAIIWIGIELWALTRR